MTFSVEKRREILFWTESAPFLRQREGKKKEINQKSAKRDKRTLSVCVAKGEANGVRENILFRRQMKRGV